MDRREFIKWMAATAVVAERGGVFAQDAQMKQKDNSMSKWIWLSPFVYPQHQHCRKDTYSSPKVTDGPGFAVVQFKKVVDCGGAVDSIRFRASGDTPRRRSFLRMNMSGKRRMARSLPFWSFWRKCDWGRCAAMKCPEGRAASAWMQMSN